MSNVSATINPVQLTNSKASFLRKALYANAIFSGISGLDFILFSNQITSYLGWSMSWLIPAIGAGLVLFAVFIVMVARADTPSKPLVQTIIASDVAWIVLSCIIIFLPATNLLATGMGGKIAIALLADIVLVFAILQFIGLRRLRAL